MSNEATTSTEPKTANELLQEAIATAVAPVAEQFNLEIKVGAVSKKQSIVITTCDKLDTPDERITSPMMKAFMDADEKFGLTEREITLGETVSILLPEKPRSQKKTLIECMLVTAKPGGTKKQLVVKRTDLEEASDIALTIQEFEAWKAGISDEELDMLIEGTANMYDNGEVVPIAKKKK